MILKLIYIFLLLSAFYVAEAQTVTDSLSIYMKEPVKNTEWIDKVNSYLKNSINSDPKGAESCFPFLINEAKKSRYKKGLFDAYNNYAVWKRLKGDYTAALSNTRISLGYAGNGAEEAEGFYTLGTIYQKLGKYDSADVSYLRAGELLDPEEDPVLAAMIYNGRATIFGERGEEVTAIEFYLKAAKIYEGRGHRRQLAVVYNNIGTQNKRLKLYAKSIEYYRKAMEINLAAGDRANLAMNYANLGVSYAEWDSAGAALAYYGKALDESLKLGYSFISAQTYLNMANLFKANGDPGKAVEYYRNSLNICEKSGIAYGIAINHLGLGTVYNEMKNYPMALSELRKAVDGLKSMELVSELSEAYKNLAQIYRQSGDYQNADKYHVLYTEIKDTLLNVERQKEFLAIETKYETEKKQNEIHRLQSESDSQKLLILYLLLALTVLALLITLFFFKRRLALREKILAEVTADKLKLELGIREKELELRNSELAEKALNLAQLQEQSKSIIAEVESAIGSGPDNYELKLKKIVRHLEENSSDEKKWEEFEFRFKEYNGEFYNRLVTGYPDLTPAEIRLVALLRLNFQNKEIAGFTRRSPRTIDNTRNSIRKKLGLEPSDNLTTFIMSI